MMDNRTEELVSSHETIGEALKARGDWVITDRRYIEWLRIDHPKVRLKESHE